MNIENTIKRIRAITEQGMALNIAKSLLIIDGSEVEADELIGELIKGNKLSEKLTYPMTVHRFSGATRIQQGKFEVRVRHIYIQWKNLI